MGLVFLIFRYLFLLYSVQKQTCSTREEIVEQQNSLLILSDTTSVSVDQQHERLFVWVRHSLATSKWVGVGAS